MLKLHGMSRSNYYRLARACLVFKRIPFEAVNAAPSQDEDYLTKSPMGRVPCLETDQGYLSETLAIAEYLDALHTDRPLLPADPWARGKTLELIRHVELDIELVARRCLPAAFFGQEASEELRQSTRTDLERGVRAVARLYVCDPYATGSEFNLADLYTFYSFGLAGAISGKIFGMDLLEGLPQVRSLLERLAGEDVIREVEGT